MTTPTYNREGITVDDVTVAASPGTQIERSCGITVVVAIPAGDNIGAMLLLPASADIGDVVEVYNIYTGENPSQNNIALYPNMGETINFDTPGNPVSVTPLSNKRLRKITSSDWSG